MSKWDEERLPDDLQEVGRLLRAKRRDPTPLELDELKLRAKAAGASGRAGGLRPRVLTALLASGVLAVGTGAVLGASGGVSTNVSASDGQYGHGHGHGHHGNSCHHHGCHGHHHGNGDDNGHGGNGPNGPRDLPFVAPPNTPVGRPVSLVFHGPPGGSVFLNGRRVVFDSLGVATVVTRFTRPGIKKAYFSPTSTGPATSVLEILAS